MIIQILLFFFLIYIIYYHAPAAISLPSLDESKQQTEAVNRVNVSISSAFGNVYTWSVWWSSPTYNKSP